MPEAGETRLKFESTTVGFQFAVDLLKLSPNDQLGDSVKGLAREKFVLASMEFYEAGERARGLAEVKVMPGAPAGKLGEIDPVTGLGAKRGLEFWRSVDFNVLEEPFVEGGNIARFRLAGFKSRLPLASKPSDVSVFFTLDRFGVGVITMWYHLEEPLTSEQLAHLQVLPMLEEPTVTASLPVELLEGAGRYERRYRELARKARDAGKDAVTFGKKNPLTFQSLAWYYWGPILNALHGNHFRSEREMLGKLRSEAYICFPVVVCERVTPELDLGSEYYEKFPRQVYQVVNQVLDIPFNVISEDAVAADLGENLSNRSDVLYLNTLGSAMVIFGRKTKEACAAAVNDPLKKFRSGLSVEEGEDAARLEQARLVFEVVDVIEVTLIQRMLLENIEDFYSSKDVIEMKASEMVRMRETLAFQLETIHGHKVFRETLARQRFERAKQVMLVEETAEALRAKLENIETAQASLHSLRSEVYQAVLGVLLGVVPSILLLTPVENSTLAGVFSMILSGLATLFANRFSFYYWKVLRRREAL
ncbi:MAG: hypothetical protein ACTSU5_13190 [Promethearchaeota archaeon]